MRDLGQSNHPLTAIGAASVYAPAEGDVAVMVTPSCEYTSKVPTAAEPLFLAAAAEFLCRDFEAALALLRQSLMAEQPAGAPAGSKCRHPD